jgi:uncharacterized protein
MQISSVIRILRIASVPVLFSAAALGLVTLHVSLQRKAERAKNRAAQAATVGEITVADRILFLKFRDLAAAAEKGDLLARIEMGRRFAQGLGVRKNEGRAVGYFQSVVNEFGEINARDKRAPQVAAALRNMSRFYRSGVAEANIAANPAYAFSLLHHAASYFGDPASQVELARLLMKGDGVTKNPRAAAQWLLSASRKGYAPAQALLGELLWKGEGVKRVPGDGLGLLAIARRNASTDDKAWVSKMFEAARAEALPIEILEANAFIVQESSASRFGHGGQIAIDGEEAAAVAETEPEAAKPSPVQKNGQQGSLIHGAAQALSEMKSNPMALTPNSFDPEWAPDESESNRAGILQMYDPSGHETRAEGASHQRYAGVVKQ